MSLSRFFGLVPSPERIVLNDPPHEKIIIRLMPQMHEIIIRPHFSRSTGLSPRQQRGEAIIAGLRSASQEAAMLVIHGGLEAACGSPLTRDQTQHLVHLSSVEKEKALAAAKKRIAELEDKLREVTTERDVLARVLRP